MSTLPRITLALLLALALASACGIAVAACPIQEIQVIGYVVGPDGAALVGASVEASWEEKAAGVVSTRRQTLKDGSFLLKIAYDTYSGKTFTGKDKCETRIGSARLAVSKNGYAPLAQQLSLGKLPDALKLTLKAL